MSRITAGALAWERAAPNRNAPIGAHGWIRYLTYRLDDSLGLRCHFAAVIVAAGAADVVRALELATIRAFLAGRRLERVMGAAHVATRLGNFLLRYRHDRFFRMKCREVTQLMTGGGPESALK